MDYFGPHCRNTILLKRNMYTFFQFSSHQLSNVSMIYSVIQLELQLLHCLSPPFYTQFFFLITTENIKSVIFSELLFDALIVVYKCHKVVLF
jgi:hypothetical protein